MREFKNGIEYISITEPGKVEIKKTEMPVLKEGHEFAKKIGADYTFVNSGAEDFQKRLTSLQIKRLRCLY